MLMVLSFCQLHIQYSKKGFDYLGNFCPQFSFGQMMYLSFLKVELPNYVSLCFSHNRQRFPDFSSFQWLCSKFGSEIHSKICSEFRSECQSEFHSKVRAEFCSKFRSKFRSEFRSKFCSEFCSQFRSEFRCMFQNIQSTQNGTFLIN